MIGISVAALRKPTTLFLNRVCCSWEDGPSGSTGASVWPRARRRRHARFSGLRKRESWQLLRLHQDGRLTSGGHNVTCRGSRLCQRRFISRREDINEQSWALFIGRASRRYAATGAD
jgi:hypothetical protein